jgi:methyl-accepting chemotaxis protein
LTGWQTGLFGWLTGSIRNKLLVTFLALALVPLAALGVAVERTATASLRDRTVAQLEAVARLQQERLSTLFQEYTRVVQNVAADPEVQDRVARVEAGDGDTAEFTAALEDRLKRAMHGIPGVDNLHICDAQGKVLADTLPGKENQKGHSKSKDPYFMGALALPGQGYVKPIYKSSTGRTSSAVSISMKDKTGLVIGVVVMRVSTKEVDRVLLDHTGMGATGESYLVVGHLVVSDRASGAEKLMATKSRFVEDSILKQVVDTEGSRRGLAQQTGSAVYPNYRGTPVLGRYTYVPELGAALVSELEEAEALRPAYRLRWVIVVAVGAAAVAVAAAALWLSRTLTRQVRGIMDVFRQIGIGNLSARAALTSRDELGEVAQSLNGMLDSTVALIQSRDERDRIQASIQKLLEEISGVADGDLTKEAEVTAEVTGAIADSFNHMIEQLRAIISNVQGATLQVSSSANEIHATAEHLARGSEGQTEQIVNTSAAVDEMAVSIQQVSENAALSAKVADEALSTAKQGATLVNNTVQGMERIRDQVQETAKRIKRLGESSQQIGEIVQLIDDIADRTSILALNASIQAAQAGEAGRGFAVVAEEVERLAERSTNATKKIANLIKTIQTETKEAITAMEEGTREVVEGSKLASQAGQALGQIEQVSARLDELIRSISLAAKQQARASEGVARSMGEISAITQQTAAGTKQAAVSVTHLAALADGLRASVSRFRLPGADGNGEGASAHEVALGSGHGPGAKGANGASGKEKGALAAR